MAVHRRLGDRDVRSDDRYLFLETVMAARDALHLSYIGEGVRDGKPRNPAAPLAELLALLDESHGLRGRDGNEAPRPWLVRHPLQPFDARYFDASDPRLFSYRGDAIALLRDHGSALPAFLDAAPAALAAAPATLLLANVLDYFRRPAEHLLHRLGLRLDALKSDLLADSEPLDPEFARIDRVAQRLFFDTAAGGSLELPLLPPDWLRHGGLWPPVRAGELAWRHQREQVGELLAEAAQSALFDAGPPQRLPLAIDLDVHGLRLQGELTRAYRSGGVDWVFDLFPPRRNARLDFSVRVGLFLEWALLHLAQWTALRPVRVLLPGARRDSSAWQDALDAWNDAALDAFRRSDAPARERLHGELLRRVGGVLRIHVRALHRPLWYFPRTSWIAAEHDGDAGKVLHSWIGGSHQAGERDHAPGYARLLASGSELEPGTPAWDELLAVARELRALIHLDAEPVA
jgi:exodeoxyribonuclease V gamma subunit